MDITATAVAVILCAAMGCAHSAFAQSPRASATPPSLQADSASFRTALDIPPQSLSSALIQYGHTVGAEILFSPAAVRDKFAGPVKGEFTREEALAALLRGSGLIHRVTAQGAIVIEAP